MKHRVLLFFNAEPACNVDSSAVPVINRPYFIAGPQKMWIPNTYIMCLESLSHLLVMIASSSNFIIYCTISTKFKIFLKRRIMFRFEPNPESASFNSNGLMLRSFRNSNVVANGIPVIATSPPRHVVSIRCPSSAAMVNGVSPVRRGAEVPLPCIVIENPGTDMTRRNGKTSVSLYKRRSNSVFPDLLATLAKSKSVSNIESENLLNEEDSGTKTETESASTIHTPNQRSLSFSLYENSLPFQSESQAFDTLSM